MKYRIGKNGLVALPTLPVTNCDDCGACCRAMGTPPGYHAPHPANDGRSWFLPAVVFDRLSGAGGRWGRSRRPPAPDSVWRVYDSAAAAADDLSAALVALGRERAAGWTHGAEVHPCVATGPHHGDRCSWGRVQAPNAQFTVPCPSCGGSGKAGRPGLPPLPKTHRETSHGR
jgi:hypothetical protein